MGAKRRENSLDEDRNDEHSKYFKCGLPRSSLIAPRCNTPPMHMDGYWITSSISLFTIISQSVFFSCTAQTFDKVNKKKHAKCCPERLNTK